MFFQNNKLKFFYGFFELIRKHSLIQSRKYSSLMKCSRNYNLLKGSSTYFELNRIYDVKKECKRACAYASSFPENKLYSSELEEFNAIGKIIHSYLTENEDECIADAINWFSKVFEFNLKHGKKNRGTAVLRAYKTLATDKVTPEGLLSAGILGWCVELLQAFFLISDDIMDQSITRRGEPCWYRKADVGLCAINDGIMLQSGVYKVLRKHFGNSDIYVNIVNEFLQATEKTAYGQCLDMLCNPPFSKPNYNCYTIEKYRSIVEYKTSYYTFCLPVQLAMHLVGNKTEEDFKLAKKICLDLGLLFQCQDDYLDCYGDPKITGKVGTDIVQGKCCWFAVTFLDNAKESHKKEWMENYAMPDPKCVAEVMHLYKEMNLLEKYKEFEHILFSEIHSSIMEKVIDKSMQDLFIYLLNKTYKREK